MVSGTLVHPHAQGYCLIFSLIWLAVMTLVVSEHWQDSQRFYLLMQGWQLRHRIEKSANWAFEVVEKERRAHGERLDAQHCTSTHPCLLNHPEYLIRYTVSALKTAGPTPFYQIDLSIQAWSSDDDFSFRAVRPGQSYWAIESLAF